MRPCLYQLFQAIICEKIRFMSLRFIPGDTKCIAGNKCHSWSASIVHSWSEFSLFSPISVQPVLIYQDEVVLNSPQASGLFIFDLERIEVLRGPQNTLYGRNTTGGAVNFIEARNRW